MNRQQNGMGKSQARDSLEGLFHEIAERVNAWASARAQFEKVLEGRSGRHGRLGTKWAFPLPVPGWSRWG